ncbi:MAG: sigma 54-interacting transcriptional regulator [Polyangiaceae bacterium]
MLNIEALKAVASTDLSVLVLGETGTGKELVAQAIHGGKPSLGAVHRHRLWVRACRPRRESAFWSAER